MQRRHQESEHLVRKQSTELFAAAETHNEKEYVHMLEYCVDLSSEQIVNLTRLLKHREQENQQVLFAISEDQCLRMNSYAILYQHLRQQL